MKSEQPAGPVRLSVNTVVDGCWFASGEELPYNNAAAVPPALQPFLVTAEPDEPPGPHALNLKPGIVYNIDDRGAILSRAGRRAAAQLAGEASWQAQTEEEAIAAGTLDPETEAALQQEHDLYIGAQLKAAEIRARDRDAAVAAAQAEADGAEQKPAAIYVKRSGAWRRAERARLRPGESIYARQPSGEGWAVGVVDANGGLPPQEVIL
jgi:hypothetical protein